MSTQRGPVVLTREEWSTVCRDAPTLLEDLALALGPEHVLCSRVYALVRQLVDGLDRAEDLLAQREPDTAGRR